MDEPLVTLALSLANLAMTVWVVKSVVDLLRQPVPDKQDRHPPTWKVAAGAGGGLLLGGAILWLFTTADPPAALLRLLTIAALGVIVFALKRETKRRQAAAN